MEIESRIHRLIDMIELRVGAVGVPIDLNEVTPDTSNQATERQRTLLLQRLNDILALQLSEIFITREELSYSTDIDVTRFRNEQLLTVAQRNGIEITSILDAFACAGIDTLSFMQFFPEANVTAVELDKTRAMNLAANVKQVERGGTISVYGGDVGELPETSYPVIYCDPPWTLEGEDREMDVDELTDFIVAKVLERFTGSLVCVKSRHSHLSPFLWVKDTQYLKVLAIECINMTHADNPTKGRYFFHYYVRNELVREKGGYLPRFVVYHFRR